jgi:hypothetical protein
MSYYIAPHSEDLMSNLVIYRVVKRLGDFKPEEGKSYRVFKSKKQIQNKGCVDVYQGINGKLKKSRTYYLLRF